MADILEHSLLGKTVSYTDSYNPELLFPIARELKRAEIGVGEPLPFKGMDIWNAYEFSWLNAQGKPKAAIAEFHFPCTSAHIIESKSFKLYLNSFQQTQFMNAEQVKANLEKDLTIAAGAIVTVILQPLTEYKPTLTEFIGTCLDELPVSCNIYQLQPDFLITTNGHINETVYSHLLKSNCPVTGQPDWASVQISYAGKPIDHAGLLRYIVSFRNYQEFHEQCVERMFMDIITRCQPQQLTVYARYTRRGGLDINPFRSTEVTQSENLRLYRQ